MSINTELEGKETTLKLLFDTGLGEGLWLFENNKIKLEKTMQLIINLSFMVSSSEKIHHKSGEPFLQ